MVYGKTKPTDIYDVEALLYVQEYQLYKFCMKLASPSVITNVAQTLEWVQVQVSLITLFIVETR